jgi:hypothetical protein
MIMLAMPKIALTSAPAPLGVPPDPDQVHVEHRVAATVIGEEVEAEIAVEHQHRERGGEDRESGQHQKVRCEGGPAEDGHAQVAHAGRPGFEDGGDEIDRGQHRADARYLQGDEVIIDPNPGREGRFAQGREAEPAGARELTEEQADVDQ